MGQVRLGAILAAVALVASGCSTSKPAKQAQAPLATTTTTAPADAGLSVLDDAGCHGLGSTPAGGELTWTVGDELRSARGCLVKFSRPVSSVAWSGDGEHLLVDRRLVLAASGPLTMEPPRVGWDKWSRPAGKALLFMTTDPEGLRHLFKQPLEQAPAEVTFLHQTDFAIYHPAGRHLVASGEDGNRHGVFIADNEGRDLRQLADGEEAVVTDAAFTASGALLFVARHGDGETHLHRLEFDPSKLTTVASFSKGPAPSALVTSPFPGGGVAYSAGGELWASRDGKVLPTKGSFVHHATPVGWLADGQLAVMDGSQLLTYTEADVRLIADHVGSVSVRPSLLPPPPPPKDIPSEAPS
jgi:hypothetical protein